MRRNIAVLVILLVVCFLSVKGQNKDVTLQGQDTVSMAKDSVRMSFTRNFRNVIKLNPTPMMLWENRNVTFSYERIINKKQSFTVGLGYLVFNNLLDDTVLNTFTFNERKKQGLNFSLEYRFYMMKRNSRPIPDGLYLAPFYSMYLYRFENGMDVIQTEEPDIAQLTGGFYAFNFGGALGYQFVFFKRMTLDLILIGPALSYYGGKLRVKGEIGLEEIKDINEDIYNKIVEKYPQADGVLIDKTFVADGKIDFLSVGYRYVIQFGFRF